MKYCRSYSLTLSCRLPPCETGRSISPEAMTLLSSSHLHSILDDSDTDPLRKWKSDTEKEWRINYFPASPNPSNRLWNELLINWEMKGIIWRWLTRALQICPSEWLHIFFSFLSLSATPALELKVTPEQVCSSVLSYHYSCGSGNAGQS